MAWEEWLLFMLDGVAATAKDTIALINDIRGSMEQYKNHLRTILPKVYSKELLDILFTHPYTKIEHVEQGLGISYDKARNMLEKIHQADLLQKLQIEKNNFYINVPLFQLLSHR